MSQQNSHQAFYTDFALRFKPQFLEASVCEKIQFSGHSALLTQFSMALNPGDSKLLLPLDQCQVNIPTILESTIESRVVVLQLENSVLSFVLEKTEIEEILIGEFASSDNIFAIDALCEIWSCAASKAAQDIIFAKFKLLFSNVISVQSAKKLGETIGSTLTHPFVETFADAFLPELLRAAV